MLAEYGRKDTVGDRYAAAWVVDAFSRQGINYKHSERDPLGRWPSAERSTAAATGGVPGRDGRLGTGAIRPRFCRGQRTCPCGSRRGRGLFQVLRMSPRVVFLVLLLAFCCAVTVATVTAVRHVSHRPNPATLRNLES